MPNIQEIKAELKGQVSRNIGNVLKELSGLIAPESDAHNDCFVLLSQFHRLQGNEIRASISPADANLEHGQLVSRILSFIDTLEEKDLLYRLLQYEVHERILVVCKSEERARYMRQFFPADYFRSVQYDHSAAPQPAAGFDIVLYDDNPPPPKDTTDELLLHYLRDSPAVVLYFGPFSLLLRDYPEKAYATNSVFSLHARIREMAEYLRYRRAHEREAGR